MPRHASRSATLRRARRTTGHRPLPALVAVVAATLALSGCTGTSPTSSAAAPPAAQSTAPAPSLGARWPLTGLPADGEQVSHPVLVVKMDNTASSSPQIGLGQADLVTEELVEGGVTRLAAFYYQRTPRLVGPVRSMRATDIGIVEPAHGVLVASGGARPTLRRIKRAGIPAYVEGAAGFRRDSSRTAPYNLFVDLATLAGTIRADGVPPSYLDWGDASDLPEGRPAKALSATFSGGHTTRWRFQDGRYTNLNSFARRGDEFRPDTVLVLRVRVGDAGYLDPAGNRVPETHFTGEGKALVLNGGRLVHATWRKKLDTPITLNSESGELRVPAGRVWIELVPVRGGKVTVGR